jgi:hypothetical protein
MSDDIRTVDQHCGGDYMVYTQDGIAVECFKSVEGAIENMVAAWHECDKPEAFTIRESERTVATICPIGSDKLIVVRDNGDTMTWEQIHYVMGDDGRYAYTHAVNNGIEYKFKF